MQTMNILSMYMGQMQTMNIHQGLWTDTNNYIQRDIYIVQ